MSSSSDEAPKPTPSPAALRKNDVEYVPGGEPWKEDHLGRREVAGYPTPLVASLRQPFVISIDAPYGGGKTYFLRNWERDLQSAEYRTVFFNAWETDYAGSPLVPFMAEVTRQLIKGKEGDGDGEILADQITAGGKKLIAATGAFLNAGAKRFIGLDLLNLSGDYHDYLGLLESASEQGDESSKGVIEDIRKQQNEITKPMETFKKRLEEEIKAVTTDDLSEKQKELGEKQQKLIVFIDELDRCRPNYAIEVLEHIKHFFHVPGTVFILGISQKQIAEAMAVVYGPELDRDGYLRRFFDWRFRLPEPDSSKFTQLLAKRFQLGDLKVWPDDNPPAYTSLETLLCCLGVMSGALGLSLRQQEQNFTEIALLLRVLGRCDLSLARVIGFLVPLRAFMKDEKQKALFDDAFPPPIMKAQDPEKVRDLFRFVKKKLDKAGTLSQLRPGIHGQDLEAAFIAWFATKHIADEFRWKEGERILARSREREDQKEDDAMWLLCMEEAEEINNRHIPPGADYNSLAELVRKRLDQVGRYIGSTEEY